MIDTTLSLAVDDREGALNQALLYPLRFEADLSVPVVGRTAFGGPACRPST